MGSSLDLGPHHLEQAPLRDVHSPVLYAPLIAMFSHMAIAYGHNLNHSPFHGGPPALSCDTVLCPSHRRLCHTRHRTLSPWTLVIQSHTATRGSSSHVFPGGPSCIQGPWVSGTL